MKNLSTLFISAALAFTACSPKQENTTVADLNARRDSISNLIETLRADLAQVDASLARLDSTRNFSSVTTLEVVQGSFAHGFQVYGTVASDRSVTLYPEMAGSISKVTVQGGERVRKGAMLVALDAAMAKASLAEVQTQLGLAQTVFEKQDRLWKQHIGSEVQFLQAKTQFESLQKRLATVQQQIGMTNIVAPFDGIVDEVFAKEGEYGAPGMPMLRIVGSGGLSLDMQVPEPYIQRISKGDVVSMNFTAIGLVEKGRVSQVGDYINPGSRTFTVSVDLPNNASLKANMMASVTIQDYQKDEALLIPNRLILQDTKGQDYTYVFIPNGAIGTIARRDLTLGLANDEMTEVLAGIAAGEKVVDRGIRSVQPGEIVKLY
ncbi:MAG: efflux RND transporter periplasmic adaptor subunit [Cryomorphaceae bacterium]|nr:efflux RND transporter periplasmic adaptor subunit [Cryomorphaceae bacterium]